jgi:hypothetical protein
MRLGKVRPLRAGGDEPVFLRVESGGGAASGVEVGRDDPVTCVLSRPLGGRNCQN